MSEPSVVLPKDGSRPGTPWWIRSTRFVVVDSSRTYDVDAVTRLREALAVAVESWQPVTPVIAAAGLTPSAGSGYDASAVDQWLSAVRAAMHEGVAPAVPPPVVPAPAAPAPAAAAAPEPVAEAPVAQPADEPQPSAMVQRINDARFTPLRFRLGYVMGEVDDFLDELVAAVSTGQPIADRVQEAAFAHSRMKECYEVADVDAFLVELVRDYQGVAIDRSQLPV